ncbi:hypothetical protein HMPREF9333_02247 [Johnsonella ignava ATCC 51276]|jgi:hypothetical protein|uniref:Flagellar assembly protein T C-terminal domain-containing protein n=1 Tax=Johnsonella ignava ATCC 51276 TaxID=679200 RepID=G5GL02_9FIRM|nr:hypothetical protein [Johnsonella ignava]EHI54605.1 hypothetical protein HMPREF9333_02247 [Johnsonella ignava ATCC 51276]
MSENIDKAAAKSDQNSIGNVIRIIDEFSLIINVGRSKINKGDIVQVYENCGTIYDIDGTKLSDYEFVKDELVVSEVHEKYAICKNHKHKNIAPLALQLPPQLVPTLSQEPLNIDYNEINPFTPTDVLVHVGDTVKLV